VKQTGFNGEFKPLKFETFTQFVYQFVGAEEKNHNINHSILVTSNPALQNAFALLDACVAQNPILFSNLVQKANLLRNLLKYDLFVYSETALEADAKKAQQINSLCAGVTKRDVLNAQLSYIIQSILGEQFTYSVPKELQNRFPKQERVWDCKLDPSSTSKQSYYKYTNIFTHESDILPELKYSEDPYLTPENEIAAVIPDKHKPIDSNKPNNMVDFYQTYYPKYNSIDFIYRSAPYQKLS
jgi:hypothetical protein